VTGEKSVTSNTPRAESCMPGVAGFVEIDRLDKFFVARKYRSQFCFWMRQFDRNTLPNFAAVYLLVRAIRFPLLESRMSQETWSAVDAYFCDRLIPADPTLEAALRESNAAGLPQHNVTPNQGKLLQLLAEMQGARKILEFGSLGGYSTIWLARALPEGGQLVTLEANPAHAAVAKANIARARLSHAVDVRVGKAIETLPLLAEEGIAPFHLIFIDADKSSNPDYLEWSLKLSRPGTVIVGDNVVAMGRSQSQPAVTAL
jgi:predicted O-methyltransferase YrrM